LATDGLTRFGVEVIVGGVLDFTILSMTHFGATIGDGIAAITLTHGTTDGEVDFAPHLPFGATPAGAGVAEDGAVPVDGEGAGTMAIGTATTTAGTMAIGQATTMDCGIVPTLMEEDGEVRSSKTHHPPMIMVLESQIWAKPNPSMLHGGLTQEPQTPKCLIFPKKV